MPLHTNTVLVNNLKCAKLFNMSKKNNTFKYNNKTYSLDSQGFLYPPEQWDEDFAIGMASKVDIYGGLTDEHWKIIKYIRKKFIDEDTVPPMVSACADNSMRLKDFKFLFPSGYHKGACKLAGVNYEFMFRTNYWLTYETANVLQGDYKMTPQGFLEDYEDWDERFAHTIIREWKLEQGLTEKHLEVINYLRKYYKENENIPTLTELCNELNMTMAGLRELFPEGYRRGACRISGLPYFP